MIMQDNTQQQNNRSMSIHTWVKPLLRKFGYVCAPVIDKGQAQVDYFVVSDYDGLQLNSN
jgi:hypothetical protein